MTQNTCGLVAACLLVGVRVCVWGVCVRVRGVLCAPSVQSLVCGRVCGIAGADTPLLAISSCWAVVMAVAAGLAVAVLQLPCQHRACTAASPLCHMCRRGVARTYGLPSCCCRWFECSRAHAARCVACRRLGAQRCMARWAAASLHPPPSSKQPRQPSLHAARVVAPDQVVRDTSGLRRPATIKGRLDQRARQWRVV